VFADRDLELASISAFCSARQDAPRVKVLSAAPKSGLTCFLRRCVEAIDDGHLRIYADAANDVANSVFAQFVVELFNRYPNTWAQFQQYERDKSGDTRTRMAAIAGAQSVPWIGGTSAVALQYERPVFPVSGYPHATAALLCDFLVRLSATSRLVLFIDNAQRIDHWSEQLLSATIGNAYDGLRYVAGIVRRDGVRPDDFVLRTANLGYNVDVEEFGAPNSAFIAALAAKLKVTLSSAEASRLGMAAGGDVYRVRAALQMTSPTGQMVSQSVSALSRAILTMLTVARQGLRRSDLLTLSLNDPALVRPSDTEVNRNLSQLHADELLQIAKLPDGDDLVTLSPSPEAIAEHLVITPTERLRHTTQLYDFFTRARHSSIRHSRAEVAPLLFRLGAIVDPDHQDEHIRQLIELSLGMGSETAAEDFINLALAASGSSTPGNFLTRISFMASLNRYENVLQLISDAPAEWSRQRLPLILRGIALNRVRKHADSESLLEVLCQTAQSPEELCLLSFYRIVGRIHANDIAGAQQLVSTYDPQVRPAHNYAYFLRNSADAYDYSTAYAKLTDAIALHVKTGDRFGWATSMSNRSTKLVALGKHEQALRDANEARDTLETFGIHHLGIATANVGHSLLYLRRFTDAASMLERALRYLRPGFAQRYVLMNLAVARLQIGNTQEACDLVDSVSDMARTSPVDRLRQKAYLNSALIHLAAGSATSVVKRYCALALQFPDRRDPEITKRSVDFLLGKLAQKHTLCLDEFFAVLSPCGLLYWYQNPLSGLPGYLLTLKTEPQNPDNELTM